MNTTKDDWFYWCIHFHKRFLSFHRLEESYQGLHNYDILRDIIWLRALITIGASALQRAAADIPSLCLKLITPDGLSFWLHPVHIARLWCLCSNYYTPWPEQPSPAARHLSADFHAIKENQLVIATPRPPPLSSLLRLTENGGRGLGSKRLLEMASLVPSVYALFCFLFSISAYFFSHLKRLKVIYPYRSLFCPSGRSDQTRNVSSEVLLQMLA